MVLISSAVGMVMKPRQHCKTLLKQHVVIQCTVVWDVLIHVVVFCSVTMVFFYVDDYLIRGVPISFMASYVIFLPSKIIIYIGQG